jgi:excisionase family DNA binding protein
MTGNEPLLDIKQAAEFLKVSEASLRRWTNSGRLACLRVGRRRERRFRRADLLAFLEEQAPPGEMDTLPTVELASRQVLIDGHALRHGTHLCGLFATEAGLVKLSASFVASGLTAQDRCVLLLRPKARRSVLHQLEKRHPSVTAAVKAGHLVFAEYQSTIEAQYDYLRASLAAAILAGARSLRVVGDIADFAEHLGTAGLSDYENGYVHGIAERFPVVTLCAYDVRRFSGLDILNAFKAHPDNLRFPREWLLA